MRQKFNRGDKIIVMWQGKPVKAIVTSDDGVTINWQTPSEFENGKAD